MDRNDQTTPHEATPRPTDSVETPRHADEGQSHEDANPPHTTTGKITSPKFGSAGSGGLELEPLPGLDKN